METGHLLETGHLVARLAEGPQDVARAQELRHLCFVAARGRGQPGGRESDRFDDLCSHLLVESAQGQLLAACRLLFLPGLRITESYSAQFYDLAPLQKTPGTVMELGRFCTRPGEKDPAILRLSWAAITRLVDAQSVSLMFGCTSFPGADPQLHSAALAHLGHNHAAPPGQGPARKGQAVDLPADGGADPRTALAAMPALLRSYLAMGGWVSDHAVIDPDLDTLHVFTAVEVARIPPARARALRALAG